MIIVDRFIIYIYIYISDRFSWIDDFMMRFDSVKSVAMAISGFFLFNTWRIRSIVFEGSCDCC